MNNTSETCPLFLTPHEAAEELQLTPAEFRRQERAGEGPTPYKLWGRTVRYYAREVRDRARAKASGGDQR